jgi:hypothetical protein
VDDAVRGFESTPLAWTRASDGSLRGSARSGGFALSVMALPLADAVDVTARVERVAPASGPAYVALVRRVSTPDGADARVRFNGRVIDGGDSPSTWDRDFWYVRGVDWATWRSHALSFASINGFTPVPTIKKDSAWVEGSHFYVWERTRQTADAMYLVSEIAGPNPDQAKSGYMPVTQYAPVRTGDALELRWRLAVSAQPDTSWAESQLRVFAGYRLASRDGAATVADLGVPSVSFGTAYFPYSTLNENFDFYRTKGLDREAFWAFSPVLWSKWRELVPRMRSDFRIIKAMGFERVRMHHLELLQSMDRKEALAFVDFYMNEARSLGLKVMIDTEGPAEWVALIAGRYKDVVPRVELENEILIYGIKPGDPARWNSLYQAVKRVAPQTEVFYTTAGNNGMFERLRDLGVPFDRVGLHLYKHGPQWKEAYSSHVLATADYARSIDKVATIGEFNWKELTKLSPEARRPEVGKVYDEVLEPRAIPEIFEFQFQESLSFNPAIAGGFTRHYEPLAVDRRPKPEAAELLRIIRENARADAPIRAMPITIGEVSFAGGRATATFHVTNHTSKSVTLALRAVAFDGLSSTLATPSRVTVQPGSSYSGRVALQLTGDASGARPGTYHHFVVASYAGGAAYGWGVASNVGAPTFAAAPVLGARVTYPQGANVLAQLRWDRPIAVAFGADASVIELEMAYTVAHTLQSATGRYVRLSSVQDLPDSLARNATLVLVGSATSNALVRSVAPASASATVPPIAGAKPAPEPGVITVRDAPNGQGQWLVLGGRDKGAVQAAAVDFVLRFWPNAKDATLRLAGMEPGNALGHRAGSATTADLP